MTFLPSHAVCLQCGTGIDDTDPATCREVIGFDRPREQGGQNHVRFRRETGRYLCGHCALTWQYAGNPEQEAMPL